MLKRSGRRVTATIAGEGPDDAALKAQAERLGTRRPGPLRRPPAGARGVRHGAHDGHSLARESLPYVVLEAAAAGMPIIATGSAACRKFSAPRRAHLIAAGRHRRRWLAAIARGARRPGEAASRRRGRSASRVRAEFSVEHHGRRRSRRLSRGAGDAKTRADSHNQFLKFVHYVAAQLLATPVRAARRLARKCG